MHEIGRYTSYNPNTQTPSILHQIQERWGSQLERMTYEQKIVIRATLAHYLAQKPVWKPSSTASCIDICVARAGANWDIRRDKLLVEAIQHCSQLEEGDIEGFIIALSKQIANKIYASRIEQWEVAS